MRVIIIILIIGILCTLNIDNTFPVPIHVSTPMYLEDTLPEPEPEPASEEKLTMRTPESLEGFTDIFQYCEYLTYKGQTYNPGKMTEGEQGYTYNLCLKYDLDYEIIMGIMGVETKWNLYIGKVKGHVGVGMIKAQYYYTRMKALGLDLYDPMDGIECLCILMRENLDKYGTYDKALIVYNCGESGALKYFNKGVYRTGYSRKVKGFAEAIEYEKTKGKEVEHID